MCACDGLRARPCQAARLQQRRLTFALDRRTPRQYGGHVATVAKLLHLGANARRVDREGHNLLHFAVSCRKEFCAPRAAIFRALMSEDPPPRADEESSGGEASAGVTSPPTNGQSHNLQDATSAMLDIASQEAFDTRARDKSKREESRGAVDALQCVQKPRVNCRNNDVGVVWDCRDKSKSAGKDRKAHGAHDDRRQQREDTAAFGSAKGSYFFSSGDAGVC